MKCKCCSKEFEPKKELHYVSRDVTKTGLVALGGGDEAKLFDTFDCPSCGCQNVFGERKRTAFEESVLEAYDEESIAVEIKDCKPLPSCFGRHDERWEDCELSGSCMNETRTRVTEETTCDKCDGRNAGECDCTLEHRSEEKVKPKCFGKFADVEKCGTDSVDCKYTKECKEVCLKDTEEEQSDESEEKF